MPMQQKSAADNTSISTTTLPPLRPAPQRRQSMSSKIKSKFSDEQLVQYRQWFDSMDTDRSGGVGIDELTNTLLSSGVVKFKKDVERIFKEMDTDNSGDVSFDEFLYAIAMNDAKRRLQLQKLDSIVNSDKLLSTETLLSLERRNVLMKHIVDKTAQRMSGEYYGCPEGRDNLKHHKKVLRVEHTHAKERADTNAMVYYLEQVVKQVKDDKNSSSLRSSGSSIQMTRSNSAANSAPDILATMPTTNIRGEDNCSIDCSFSQELSQSFSIDESHSVVTPHTPRLDSKRSGVASYTPQQKQSMQSGHNKIVLRKIGCISGEVTTSTKLGRMPSLAPLRNKTHSTRNRSLKSIE
eukprot:CAMPEP_0185026018 /NCGR_PEP_ID=MMETSP1103-20130426/9559_1 /TAXON_ID=36769 /ORGANISM="Paraphysomonas bandaiensis, Strain Caron Lab Isolate" /LENGTH=350 /DNA_ID=CAMNT_0027559437 /DNA_START=212 /DNA_END=1264 /DNA_ORIENTATION=+